MPLISKIKLEEPKSSVGYLESIVEDWLSQLDLTTPGVHNGTTVSLNKLPICHQI